MSIDIHGVCEPRFEPVREAFAANFAEGKELGARFAFSVEGEIVVDLWAGWADKKQTVPFDDRTLTPVYSTTKAVAATMIARLVEQGRLRWDQPVAEVWPEFGCPMTPMTLSPRSMASLTCSATETATSESASSSSATTLTL